MSYARKVAWAVDHGRVGGELRADNNNNKQLSINNDVPPICILFLTDLRDGLQVIFFNYYFLYVPSSSPRYDNSVLLPGVSAS